jgi:hypothetical protein
MIRHAVRRGHSRVSFGRARWPSRSRIVRLAWVTLVATGMSSGPVGSAPPTASSPVAVQEITRRLPDAQPVRGWVARVDLTDARVSFVVPGPAEGRDGDRTRVEAVLVPVDAWARRADADLAVNANFFARLPGALPIPWANGQTVDILGLAMSAGVQVSPPRGTGQRGGDPALLIDESVGTGDHAHCPCRAQIRLARRVDLRGVDEAVSGMGGSEGTTQATLLVEGGRNRGATARVQPLKRHPRTAAGITRDGRTLLLVVVDGRQPGWSAGATLVELADLMRDLGAWTALALDGGGSSAFWWRAPGEPEGKVRNRPSDGHVRPVANALGVRLGPRPAR